LHNKFTIIIILFFSCYSVNAEIFHCLDKQGKSIFSDSACGENANKIDLKTVNSYSPSEKKSWFELSKNKRADLQICGPYKGTRIPIKLCENDSPSTCNARSSYLKNVITDYSILKEDKLTTQDILALKNATKPKHTLWSFNAPNKEWDLGTGIRGYIITHRHKATYVHVVLYQGLPNKFDDGTIRWLPSNGIPKRCRYRSIMDN